MPAVSLNTLAASSRLPEKGFVRDQAGALAEMRREEHGNAKDFATRRDIAILN